MSRSLHVKSALMAAAIAIMPVSASALHGVDIIPGGIPASDIQIELKVIASGGDLTAPNFGTYAPGLPDYLFVTDQDGELWAVKPNADPVELEVFLDVSSLIVPLGARLKFNPPLDFDERGLIGVAFHPNFASNGKFYTFTSEPVDGPGDFTLVSPAADSGEFDMDFADLMETFPNHQSVISEWTANDPADPSAGVNGTRRVLMRIDQPQFNHNSGALNFGPDGMLYATIGDGGGADDSPEADLNGFLGVPILGHGMVGNAQNTGNILGNIIRIDPDGTNASNGQYGIPDDNPFVPDPAVSGEAAVLGGDAGCADGWCDEIYAYGFRNPFRFSFDQKNGNLFLADVGQNDVEEVDIVLKGGNYGWKSKEGTFLFDANGPGDGLPTKDSPNMPPGMIDPIAQYDHDEGVAVLGGFVYHGTEVGALRGRYVFAEFAAPPFSPFAPPCDGRVFHLNKRINAQKASLFVPANKFDGEMREFPGNVAAGRCLLGLGQDAHGEVYVFANDTGLPKETSEGAPADLPAPVGVIMKIVAKH